jgi:LysR family transcriptional regulator, transcription activator of glutamate synthase operon
MTIQRAIHDVWSFDVDTDVLRWFKLVADGATVTEVSDLEPVTQSGVSRALARLEAEVGTPLLQRSGRTLTPTLAGEVFRPYADGILQQLSDGLAAVAQFVSPDTGTVAIAFQQSLGSWLVPDLVRSFRADHPDVRFDLTEVRDELRGLPLGGGRTDLEVGTRRFRTGKQAIRPGDLPVWTRQIGVEPLRLALPRDHRLAGHPRIALAEVADEPFIGLRPTSALRELGDELCMQAGFRPAVVFEGDDLAIVRGLVAAGLGVAIVPAPRAESPEAARGPVRYAEITDDGAQRAIYLTWPADRPLLPAADLFRKHVLRTVIAGRIRPVSDFT